MDDSNRDQARDANTYGIEDPVFRRLREHHEERMKSARFQLKMWLWVQAFGFIMVVGSLLSLLWHLHAAGVL